MAGAEAGKVFLSWEQAEQMSVDLSDMVLASDLLLNSLKLLALWRGASFPANILSRRLDMGAGRILSASLTSYPDSEEQPGSLEVGQFPSAAELEGQDLLIVDEVCDTGQSLQHVVERVLAGGARSIASAVLHYKPSRSTTGYVPDFYVEETADWIVYPWELHEAENRGMLLSAAALSDVRVAAGPNQS